MQLASFMREQRVQLSLGHDVRSLPQNSSSVSRAVKLHAYTTKCETQQTPYTLETNLQIV
jgi:hypothetical protein